MTLDELSVGQDAEITAVDRRGPVTLRLMEMGLVPGAVVRIRKRAPFGGPMELSVSGYHLSIRNTEANALSVDAIA